MGYSYGPCPIETEGNTLLVKTSHTLDTLEFEEVELDLTQEPLPWGQALIISECDMQGEISSPTHLKYLQITAVTRTAKYLKSCNNGTLSCR